MAACVFPVGWGQGEKAEGVVEWGLMGVGVEGVSVDSSELGFLWKRPLGKPCPSGHYFSPGAIPQSVSSFFFLKCGS